MRGPYQPLEYAAISSRLLSCVVDIALVCGVWAAALIVGLIAMMTVASTETRGNMGAWFLVFYAIALGMIVVLSLYSVFAWSGDGQTLGKKATRSRVVAADGERLGVGRAIVRLIGYYICFAIFPLGYLPAAFDRERRALHDMIAGTRVVVARVRHPGGREPPLP